MTTVRRPVETVAFMGIADHAAAPGPVHYLRVRLCASVCLSALRVSLRIFVYVYEPLCMPISLCIGFYERFYVRLYVCPYVRASIHVSISLCAPVLICIHLHASVYLYIRFYASTRLRAPLHTSPRLCTPPVSRHMCLRTRLSVPGVPPYRTSALDLPPTREPMLVKRCS